MTAQANDTITGTTTPAASRPARRADAGTVRRRNGAGGRAGCGALTWVFLCVKIRSGV